MLFDDVTEAVWFDVGDLTVLLETCAGAACVVLVLCISAYVNRRPIVEWLLCVLAKCFFFSLLTLCCVWLSVGSAVCMCL